MHWLLENKEWIFSGIGVFAISAIVAIFVHKKGSIIQNQKSGNNSKNIQANGNVTIGNSNDK